jgi:GT2 family glycosyltransferase
MNGLTVIVPNYNGKKFLKNCFESIEKQNNILEVVIIDNGSDDGSVEFIKENYPEYILIENRENLGFSKAVNQGIKRSNAEYCFLLNNDVELESDCTTNLLKCIEKDENIFAVASKMVQFKDRNMLDDAGDEYTILGWTKKVGEGKSSKLYTHNREIFSACAGAALYRKKIFEVVGYFDENFFAYMEDVDLGYRAKIYGFKSVYCSDAVVYHHVSATSGSRYNAFKIRLAARNNIYVAYKNMPWPQLLLNLIFLLIGFIIKYLFFVRKGHGTDYINGLREGLNSLDKIDKIKYKKGKFINYIRIEWILLKNTVKSIYF